MVGGKDNVGGVFKDDELLGFLFFIFHFALRPFLEKMLSS